jgi:hypothetical protein
MDAGVTALIIAIVGVVGTLSASIASQIMSVRAKREEFLLQRSHRQEDYDRERAEAVLAQKRSCYISIMSSSRRYRVELMNYLFTIKRDSGANETSMRLEDARLAFSVSFAEAQLTGSLPVLEAVNSLRNGLREGYRTIKELEADSSKSDDSFNEVQNFLLRLWESWPPMHEAMRADLGVKD